MGSKWLILRQYGTTFAVTLNIIAVSTAMGWTSPSLPKLEADDSPILITPDQSSWITAFIAIGSITGPIFTAFVVDRWGRKTTLLITAFASIAAWIMIGLAKSVQLLYVARFFNGIALGTAYCITPMYLGEVAIDKIRGSIGTLITVMSKVGILLVYSVGPFVDIDILAWIMITLPIAFILIFFWFPESPYCLILKNKPESARKSLKWLRANGKVDEEFEQIKMAVEKSQENKGKFKDLIAVGNRRALFIVLGLGVLQQICGSQPIIANAESFFTEVDVALKPHEWSIILAIIQVVMAALSSLIVDKLGRKPLLVISNTGVSICTGMTSIYFMLKHNGHDVEGAKLLPAICIMVFFVFYSVGLATVPYAIMSEIFPTNIKAIASALFPIVSGIAAAIMLKIYQAARDNIGLYFPIGAFSIAAAVWGTFLFFFIPETKGKPLAVILEDLKNDKTTLFFWKRIYIV